MLRAAKEITGEDKFIVVGSQSLHGKGIDVDQFLASIEVASMSRCRSERPSC